VHESADADVKDETPSTVGGPAASQSAVDVDAPLFEQGVSVQAARALVRTLEEPPYLYTLEEKLFVRGSGEVLLPTAAERAASRPVDVMDEK